MQHEDIHIGAAYTCTVGRNTVEVTVTGEIEGGGWHVKTPTGRTMTVRSADRFVGRVGDVTVAATPVAEAQGEPCPDTAVECGTVATGGAMSLLAAAVHLLGQADGPMQCKDLVDQAREQGLWAPKRGGKTPDRTLYAAILREITTKGDDARFRKVERGHFALNG